MNAISLVLILAFWLNAGRAPAHDEQPHIHREHVAHVRRCDQRGGPHRWTTPT